MNNIIICGCWC